MPVIDADAHVDETEDIWAYIDEAHRQYTPVTVMQDPASSGGTQPQGYNRYSCLDGRFLVRRIRDDKREPAQGVAVLRGVPDGGGPAVHYPALRGQSRAGTDYSHADQSAEIRTLSVLREMGGERRDHGRSGAKDPGG